MRIGKRLLALVCTTALLLSLVGTAFAAGADTTYTLTGNEQTAGKGDVDCTYTVNSDGDTVTLTGINYLQNKSKTIVIPDTLDGKTVTAVNGKSDGTIFTTSGQYYVEKLVLPASVTFFSPRALDGYSSSKKGDGVNFTAVEVSAENAIYKSEGGVLFSKDGFTLIYYPLDKVGGYTVPSDVTAIGDRAFYGAQKLTDITFSAGLLSIGKFGVALTGITTLTLPDTIISLGDSAFSDNYKLTNLALPASVTNIGTNLFSSCREITTAVVGMPVIPVGFLRSCSSLNSLTLEEGVTEIGEGAFYGCNSLVAITLPASLTTIGKEAFAFNYKLASVSFNDGLTTIGEQAFWMSGFSGALNLPTSMTTLGKQAFAGTKITSIGSLGGVTHLPENVFSGCDLLTVVTVPNTIKTMDTRVFYDCAGLQEITLPDGLTSIPSGAFQFVGSEKPLRETHLKKVNIPTTVTSIGDSAFAGNHILERIELPPRLTSLGNYAFQNCRKLTAIAIPDGVTALGTSMFEYCWSLVDIKLPASLKEVGTSTFNHCSALQRLEFPATLEKLGVYHGPHGDTYSDAFGHTPELLSVTFLGSKPYTGTFRPFASASSSGHHTDLTVYHPLNNNTYGDWSTWTYPAIATGKPTDPPAKDTGITLQAVLEHSRQGVLLLWCTVDITPEAYSDDNNLAPSGAVSYTLGGDALPKPIYFVGGNTSLHQTIGYRLSEDLIDKNITIQAHLPASVGFNASQSDPLPGLVVKPEWDKQLPFGSASVPPATRGYVWAPAPSDSEDAPAGAIIIGLSSDWNQPAAQAVRLTADSAPAVILPGELDSYLVTGLGERLFAGTNVGSVVIPATVRTLGADVFKDCTALATVTMTGNAPTLAEGNNPFPENTILRTAANTTGYDEGIWATMARESVALGITVPTITTTDFTIGNEIGKMTLNLPFTFVTTAFTTAYPGVTAPAPDLSKLEVLWVLEKDTKATFTSTDNILQVSVPPELFGRTCGLKVHFLGDEHYTSVTVDVKLDNTIPIQKIPLTIDSVATEVKENASGELVLWLTPTFNPENYYGQLNTTPYLVLLHVTLDGKEARVISIAGNPTVTVPIPTELIGQTVPVGVTFKGESKYFVTPSNTITLENVYLSDAPKPAVTLTSIAVTTPPTKTAYFVGDTFEPAGMVVTATYSDTTTKPLATAEYTITPGGAFTEAKTVTMTVTSGGKTATCNVTVTNKPDPVPPSGGGGGGSAPAPAPAPAPSAPVNVKVTVSDSAVKEAIKSAEPGQAVVLTADVKEGATSVAVTVSAGMMKAIAKAEAPVSLKTPVADLTLDVKVLEALQAKGVKDVVVSAGAADTAALPKAAQDSLAGRPVYDINITAGGKGVSQFDGGTVTVALPYTPTQTENSAALVACWVKDDGTMEVLQSSSFSDGKLSFKTPHLSTYAIVHREVSFPDVAEDYWAKAPIDFVVARGILGGTGDDLFSPTVSLTGTMAVVALARMDGVATGPFGDGWADPALEWAAEKRILPDGFSPDAALSREHLAYLVAGYMGGAKAVSVSNYLDMTDISAQCLLSVQYLSHLGVMNGTGDGYFSPTRPLSRGELAAVLQRLVTQ